MPSRHDRLTTTVCQQSLQIWNLALQIQSYFQSKHFYTVVNNWLCAKTNPYSGLRLPTNGAECSRLVNHSLKLIELPLAKLNSDTNVIVFRVFC